MQPMNSEELNRRITTFLTKKNEEFPELQLLPHDPKENTPPTAVEVISDLLAGIKWEFGR